MLWSQRVVLMRKPSATGFGPEFSHNTLRDCLFYHSASHHFFLMQITITRLEFTQLYRLAQQSKWVVENKTNNIYLISQTKSVVKFPKCVYISQFLYQNNWIGGAVHSRPKFIFITIIGRLDPEKLAQCTPNFTNQPIITLLNSSYNLKFYFSFNLVKMKLSFSGTIKIRKLDMYSHDSDRWAKSTGFRAK